MGVCSMNSKERTMLSFDHQEADKVPVGEMEIMSPVASRILNREAVTYGGATVTRCMQLSRKGQRDDFVKAYQRDILELHDKLDLDVVSVQLDPPADDPFDYEDVFENSWIAVNRNTGEWAKNVFDRESDIVVEVDSSIKQGQFEALEQHISILEQSPSSVDRSRLESIEWIAGQVADERFLLAKLPNLIPTGLSWTDLFYELMYLDPPLAQRLCNVYLQKALAVAEEYVRIGVHCILIASDWAHNSGPFVSPELIERYWVPQVRTVAELAHRHGVLVMKHTDGNIMKIAEPFFGMGIDAYQGIEAHAGMSLPLIKREYGHRITLMGNVDCGRVLPFGTKQEIIAETKRAIREGAPGGGFILSSNNTIHSNIPAGNYLTMLEAAKKYGSYPIADDSL